MDKHQKEGRNSSNEIHFTLILYRRSTAKDKSLQYYLRILIFALSLSKQEQLLILLQLIYYSSTRGIQRAVTSRHYMQVSCTQKMDFTFQYLLVVTHPHEKCTNQYFRYSSKISIKIKISSD